MGLFRLGFRVFSSFIGGYSHYVLFYEFIVVKHLTFMQDIY
jgi:hypothetical protein